MENGKMEEWKNGGMEKWRMTNVEDAIYRIVAPWKSRLE